MHAHSLSRRRSRQAGFTLIELLVVVGILLILATATVMLINTTLDSDRGRSASRILQSALAGARDRAIYSTKSPQGPRNVGVRLLTHDPLGLNGQPERWVTTLQYVEQTPPYTTGDVTVDASGQRVTGNGTDWLSLFQRGLLNTGSTIRIPDGPTGVDYTVDTQFLAATPSQEVLMLTTAMQSPPGGAVPYQLHLEPSVAPNSEPIKLPTSIFVDLAYSDIPPVAHKLRWVDIMFTPSGKLAGPAQAGGFFHLVLRDREDIDMQRSLSAAEREQFLVTVVCSTGQISTHGIDQTDADGDGEADDPFLYAISGDVAGQ